MYNMFTCVGFSHEIMGGCSLAWLGFGLLLFLVLICRKQFGDFLGWDYNVLGGFAGAFLPYFIIESIFGAVKWALLAGIVGSFIGGLLSGSFLGGGSSDDEFG